MRIDMRRAGPCWTLALVLWAFDAQGRVLSVGPAGEFKRIAEAARHARDGDMVEIAPGRYVGDAAIWTQDRLTIRGTGDGVVLEAGGVVAEGKAIWVIRGGRINIQHLTFVGARADDRNGAGIRFERGTLSVRDVRFADNQMGLITGNDPAAELHVEDCLFSDAPATGDMKPHLLYVGAIGSLTIQGSRFQRGYKAHLIKSRARVNHLIYNVIDDGPEGEAAYELEFPNGGQVTLLGNHIGQGARSTNPAMLAYGAEGPRWSVNVLRVHHNTFQTRGLRPGLFVRIWRDRLALPVESDFVNNLFIGVGIFMAGEAASWRGNYRALSWGPESAPPSPIRWEEGAVVAVNDGVGTMRPRSEPAWPIGDLPLPELRSLVPGAYQTRAQYSPRRWTWRMSDQLPRTAQ